MATDEQKAGSAAAPSPPAPAAVTKHKGAAGAQPEKPLTNAELKAKAKAEKAARRAAAKPAQASAAGPTEGRAESGGKAAGGKPKGKQDGVHSQSSTPGLSDKAAPRPANQVTTTTSTTSSAAPRPKKQKPAVAECFRHLPVPKRVPVTEADDEVHEEIVEIGQRMCSFELRDSISRASSLLLALKEVVKSYQTPENTSLSRHFTSHVLNPQIEYLTECRPLCVAMGNAIRWFKLQVSKIDVGQSDKEAKQQLCDALDAFFLQKVVISGQSVAQQGARTVADGDVVLVFASHPLTQEALLIAHRDQKRFEVLVVDDAFDATGAQMARTLRDAGVRVTYFPDMTMATIAARQSTKTFVAAETLFEDGSVQARVGSADVALASAAARSPVLVMCQSLNTTDRMPTDAFTYNEVDPEMASNGRLRLLYDIIKPTEVDMVLLEDGNMSTQLLPDILKKLEFL